MRAPSDMIKDRENPDQLRYYSVCCVASDLRNAERRDVVVVCEVGISFCDVAVTLHLI